MSSTLMWEPVHPNVSESLPDELKHVISRRLWGTDGSCGGGQVPMGTNDLPYLEGLRDAGVKGADELIEAVKLHGAVYLWHAH